MQALFDYYNTGIEQSRLARNLCNRLEFETTLHVLMPYKANANFLLPLAATGLIQDDSYDRFGLSAYFSTPDEMEALVRRCGARLLEHVAADGASKLIEDVVNRMNEEQYQQWRAWHWQACRERSILGYSTHGLMICQKPK